MRVERVLLAIGAVATGCSFTPGEIAIDAQTDAPNPVVIDAGLGAIDASFDAAPDAAPDAFVCSEDCDDDDPCTEDACVVGIGCQHTQSVPDGCEAAALFTCAGEETCYAYCKDGQTWTDAESRCVTWGGHLATVLNDAESACLGDIIQGERGWIGYYQPPGTQEPNSGWLWADGSAAVPDTNWGSGQPNDRTDQDPEGQDCVYILPQGFWRDTECDGDWGYVCER